MGLAQFNIPGYNCISQTGSDPPNTKTQKMKLQIQLKNGQDYTDVYYEDGSIGQFIQLGQMLELTKYDSSAHGLYVVSLEFKSVDNEQSNWTFYTYADPMPHV